MSHLILPPRTGHTQSSGVSAAAQTIPFLSVVIPAYNEEQRLPKVLDALSNVLCRCVAEVIVVCDGCTDKTAVVAAQWADRLQLRIINDLINRGKGYAVRQGVRAARGQIIAFMDADGSTPPFELLRLAAPILSGQVDIVIGSRRAAGRDVQRQPIVRHCLGALLSLTTRTVLNLPYLDTQCGFKLFRRDQAQKLFNRMLSDGFEFDLELLCLAEQMNMRTLEMGVFWRDCCGSKVSPIRDGLRMLATIRQMRSRHVIRPETNKWFSSRRKILDIKKIS